MRMCVSSLAGGLGCLGEMNALVVLMEGLLLLLDLYIRRIRSQSILHTVRCLVSSSV